MHQFQHVVDVDGDGAEDVLDGASGNRGNRISLRRNLGGWRSWQATPIPLPERVGEYQALRTGDLDLDGDLDVVTSEQIEQLGVIWYENPATAPPATRLR